MSNYTQYDWSALARQLNKLVVEDVQVCFPRQARNAYKPKWHVVVLSQYGYSVYEIDGFNDSGMAIPGHRTYTVTPPDWVYDEAQRAIAEHTQRYEELLNALFLNTPEKRAEHLANKLAGIPSDLSKKESEVYEKFLTGWKARIKRMTAGASTHDKGMSYWISIEGRRLSFDWSSNGRPDIYYSGSFLQMYASRELIDEEVNVWIHKILA
jgi:hypothetical protein